MIGDISWVDVPLPGLELPSDSVFGTAEVSLNDPTLPITAKVEEAFWSRVVRGSEPHHCAIWVGSISGNDGYGRLSWQSGLRTRTMSAHRFALALTRGGTLPEGVVGEHACNEPLCVRTEPGHLHLSTQSANLRYAVALGRHRGNTPTVTDGRSRADRSRAVRAAVIDGWDTAKYLAAVGAHPVHRDQIPLF